MPPNASGITSESKQLIIGIMLTKLNLSPNWRHLSKKSNPTRTLFQDTCNLSYRHYVALFMRVYIVAEWAKSDPRSTAAWLEKLPRDKFSKEASTVLAWEWAKVAPEEAAAWAELRVEAAKDKGQPEKPS